ncbi:hypothetical protein SK128_002481 [Halocaridina rubra]|uniref:Uncharacterized protein n=1 Tax=Halocaridina rubra TaxID=373956 RepID=A0AAN8XIA6_HALRR
MVLHDISPLTSGVVKSQGMTLLDAILQTKSNIDNVVLFVTVGITAGGYPYVTPTVGQIWPCPQMITSQQTYMIVRPDIFKFNITGQSCDILQKALTRYMSIMFHTPAAKKVISIN